MQHFTTQDWGIALGAGMIWIGALIVANSGLPRLFRRGPTPTAEPGSERAFLLFWLDQYAFIGIALCGLGLIAAIWGLAA